MVCIKSLLAFGLFGAALAAPARTPTTEVSKRQSSGDWTCGNNHYSASDIAAAQQVGCSDEQSGQTVGRNSYPHAFDDREGFSIPTQGPWYEFPILSSGASFDGSMGPSTDRVIFNSQCEFTLMVTHTGAHGNNFELCTQDGGSDN